MDAPCCTPASRSRTRSAPLEFFDGLTLDAQIVSMLDDQDRDQVWYRVLRLVSPGHAVRPAIEPGHQYATDLQQFARATAGPVMHTLSRGSRAPPRALGTSGVSCQRASGSARRRAARGYQTRRRCAKRSAPSTPRWRRLGRTTEPGERSEVGSRPDAASMECPAPTSRPWQPCSDGWLHNTARG